MREIDSLIGKVKEKATQLTELAREEDDAPVAPETETPTQPAPAEQKPEAEGTAEPAEGTAPPEGAAPQQEGEQPKETAEAEEPEATINLPDVPADTLPDETEMLAEALADDQETQV